MKSRSQKVWNFRISKTHYLLLTILFCFNTISSETKNTITLQVPLKLEPNSKTVLVDLFFPKKILEKYKISKLDLETLSKKQFPKEKVLLVLPGWKFSRKKWQEETRLLEFLEKHSFIGIFPEMHTTLYESSFFPESKNTWNPVPGRVWINQVLFPYLQKNHSLLSDSSQNFLLGLSTGARGVALLYLDHPTLFKGIAMLSGDFDQTLMPNDTIMTYIYGSFEKFPERWATIDNPSQFLNSYLQKTDSSDLKTSVYISHGLKDSVVPSSQSKSFSEIFLNSKKFTTCTGDFSNCKNAKNQKLFSDFPKTAKHDFLFWDGELPKVFSFFEIL